MSAEEVEARKSIRVGGQIGIGSVPGEPVHSYDRKITSDATKNTERIITPQSPSTISVVIHAEGREAQRI